MSHGLILDHLYDNDRESLVDEMLSRYRESSSVVVNFLYFSNAMHYRLLEQHRDTTDLAYKQALLMGDFLLADGIALQVYKRSTDLTWVRNLNGTDLMPWLLHRLTQNQSVSLYVYSVYDPQIGKDKSRLERGLDALLRDFPGLRIASSYQSQYADRGSDFPFDQFEHAAAKDDADLKIFLNCTGTSFQEIRVEAHREWFSQQQMIVMNVGGFLDFVSGFETRAPQWIVQSRILETPYRIFSRPHKNMKKFLRMFGLVRVWKKQFVNALARLFHKK